MEKKFFKLFLIPIIGVVVLIAIIFTKNITVQKSMAYESPGCNLGQYYNGTSCVTCPEGYDNTDNYNATSINQCFTNVPSGSFIPSPTSAVQRCGSGTVRNGTEKVYYGSTSSTCTVCSVGTYANLSQSSCESCPSGTTSPAGSYNVNQCTAMTVECPQGKYLPANSTVCTTCRQGYYCPGGNLTPSSTSAVGITPCPTGHTSEAGVYSQSQCKITCQAGTYKNSEGAYTCSTCPSGTTSNQHTVYYGQKSPEGTCYNATCTLTYNANGGSDCTSNTGACGRTISSLCTSERSGYTFDGWYTSATGGTQFTTSTNLNSNMTVYAHWTPAPAANNCVCGTLGNENTYHTEACGTNTSCTDVCNGYGQSVIAGKCSGTCTLTYNANGGSGCTSGNAGTCGRTISPLCTPTRSGYTFIGWYTEATGGTEFTTSTKLDSSMTVYAHWTSGDAPTPDPVSVTSVSVKPTTWLLGIGEQKTLYSTISPETATNKNISWSNSNSSVATTEEINSTDNMVTGVEVGEAEVTVTTEDGNKTATSVITVVGSNTTKQIMNTRIDETFTKLTDAAEDIIHKDQNVEKDSSGNLLYPFGLGCELGEYNCFDRVEYGGQAASMVEDGTTITIEQIKAAWNAGSSIQPENRWDENCMNDGTATIANNAIKNEYYAIYKNAGKWQGKNIDVKATVVDFEPMQDERYLISEPAILLTNKEIGVAVTGIKWVKVKYEFLDSSTGNKVSLKGNTTYWDIDQNQGVIVDSDNTNQGIFFVNNGLKYNNLSDKTVDNVDNQLYYQNISDGIYIFDQNTGIDQNERNPLYPDDLNSTAYAFTEQFEGSEIIRTFQYSNPVFKNSANERVWNGHGAVYVSSTVIRSDIQHVIITEVENGEIDPSTSVYDGDDETIHYSPNSGYTLSYIEIDGVKQDLKDITSEYTFKNVTQDHTIKVVYALKNAKTGLFEVGGVLIATLAAGGIAYFLIRKKQISNV